MQLKRNTLPLSVALLYAISGCEHPSGETNIPKGGYPGDVANIIINKCAISGCHNNLSYTNAGNLRMDTWAALLQGSNNGAVVVPFSPENSPLLFYVNTDSNLGPVATPTMPLKGVNNALPLTKREYAILYNWIKNGARDANENVPFAEGNSSRQKMYLTQQGCDKIAVIDGTSHLIMRYINVGTSNSVESPHSIKIQPGSKYGYVSFLAGNSVQKIDLDADSVVASADLSAYNGSWNVVYAAPNNSEILVTDFKSDGKLVHIDANTMQVLATIGGGSLMVYPHGIASIGNMDTIFTTSQYGNVIYKISRNQRYYKKLSIDGNAPVEATSSNGSPDPHEIVTNQNGTKGYITCEGTNEFKVLDLRTGKIDTTIKVGRFPQEITLMQTPAYAFVTCMEDDNSRPGMKGSVYAINLTDYTKRKIEGDFYQPHGIAVDEINHNIYVASTNSNPSGPAPHHATACTGRAGWYSVIDATTFTQKDKRRYQVLVLPYSFAARHPFQ